MCGIAGYVGAKNASEVIIEELKRMEYRGYDSAGITVAHKDELFTLKTVGKLNALEELISAQKPKLNSHCAIGHTRWATHGKPSPANAHPHTTPKVSVVHNGIIENSAELKNKLIKLGYEFESETDTEAVAKLLDYYYNGDPVETILCTQKELVGTYALGIMFKGYDDTLFGLRKESPLIVGLGNNENFLCSDLNAILNYTNKYYILENNELAVIKKDSVAVFDQNGQKLDKKINIATWQADVNDKHGFEHFMLKEIFEQPHVLEEILKHNIKNGLPDLELQALPNLEEIEKIIIVACGSARYAGLLGKYWIEKFARLPVEVEIASEFRYSYPILTSKTLVICISQSGETADTLAALRLAKLNNVPTLGIINVKGSSMSREADHVIYTNAGAEVAVASTKAYMAQICILYLLAVELAFKRKTLQESQIFELSKDILDIPEKLLNILKDNLKEVENLANFCSQFSNIFFIGRGLDSAIAKEGALKLKELAYINAQSYVAGELKHGPISLITENALVISLLSQERLQKKMISNILEAQARGGQILLISKEKILQNIPARMKTLELASCSDDVMPFLTVVVLQLLAYCVAKTLGHDVDKPRNLAKSVTVE